MTEFRAGVLRLPLKNPFHIAHGSSEYRENVFLRISAEGCTAYGEAAVVPYYGINAGDIIEDMRQHLDREMISAEDPLPFISRFTYPVSACAYSSALLALRVKREQRHERELLGCPVSGGTAASSITIGYTSDTEQMLQSIADEQFPAVKLKAGFPDDLERVALIRRHFPALKIRIDANQGWTMGRAVRMIRALEPMDIELIEEPVRGTPGQLAELSRLSSIPIVLDESIQTVEHLKAYAPSVSGVVVKLAKSGGPHAARLLIQESQRLGLEVMLSCMVESSLAVSAALAVAPLCRWLDLDAPRLLSSDPFTPIRYQNGIPEASLSTISPSREVSDMFDRTESVVLE